MGKNQFLFLSFSILFIVGCENEERFRPVDNVPVPEVQSGAPAPIVTPSSKVKTQKFIQKNAFKSYDFLWIVDNSRSMLPIRDYLKQNLTHFVSILESRQQLDWQMAVTITDHAVQNGNLIRSASGTNIVSKHSFNPQGEWNSIISNVVDTKNSQWEQGLESGYSALNYHFREFTRPSVPLMLVYVTDEQDYSCMANCRNFKGEPENFSNVVYYPVQRYSDQIAYFEAINHAPVMAFPVTNLQSKEENTCSQKYHGSKGWRYLQLQSLVLTGMSQSLCMDHLKTSLDNIAQLTADQGVCFSLADKNLQPQTLAVRWNGNPIPKTYYQYEFAKSQICFTSDHTPPNGTQVEVDYEMN